MTKQLPIEPQALVMSEKKQRFIQELHDHEEDSGQTLDSPAEIAEVFNAYATPRRNTRLAILAAIACFTFLPPFLAFRVNNLPRSFTSPEPVQFFLSVNNSAAMMVTLPLTYIYYMPAQLLNQVVLESGIPEKLIGGQGAAQTFNVLEEGIFQAVPFVASFFWTLIAIPLLFSPRDLLKRRA
jgi:hypothetical protein